MTSPSESTVPSEAEYQILASRNFIEWLAESRISLAFTTYQAGKLFFVGRSAANRLNILQRTFDRAMGLWSNGQELWLASAFQLWRFQNVLAAGTLHKESDRLYLPLVGYTTGDIDVHDVAVDDQGRVVFVSTLFSCLGTVSDSRNFTPLWRPPFISRLAAEDRCHLNGLAMEDGQPRYATACSQSDVVDGWRDQRATGGCVIDIRAGDIVAEGLAMPHSPRIYQGELWLLNSGEGELGRVDRNTGRFEPVTFCPGYARGLAMHGRYAIVGLSRPREATFQRLPLDAHLSQRNATARTGLQVVDLDSGEVVHWLRIEGLIEELYDVVVLPDVVRPSALGFKSDEIRRNVWLDVDDRVTHWSAGPAARNS